MVELLAHNQGGRGSTPCAATIVHGIYLGVDLTGGGGKVSALFPIANFQPMNIQVNTSRELVTQRLVSALYRVMNKDNTDTWDHVTIAGVLRVSVLDLVRMETQLKNASRLHILRAIRYLGVSPTYITTGHGPLVFRELQTRVAV